MSEQINIGMGVNGPARGEGRNMWPYYAGNNCVQVPKTELLTRENVWCLFCNTRFFDRTSINARLSLTGRDDDEGELFSDILGANKDDGVFYTAEELDTELFLITELLRTGGEESFVTAYVARGDGRNEDKVIECPTIHEVIAARTTNCLFALEKAYDTQERLRQMSLEEKSKKQ